MDYHEPVIARILNKETLSGGRRSDHLASPVPSRLERALVPPLGGQVRFPEKQERGGLGGFN